MSLGGVIITARVQAESVRQYRTRHPREVANKCLETCRIAAWDLAIVFVAGQVLTKVVLKVFNVCYRTLLSAVSPTRQWICLGALHVTANPA